MAIRKYKRNHSARRQMTVNAFEELTAVEPYKPLTVYKKANSGRNNQGKLTVRHRGGGVKKLYRMIDKRRNDKNDIPASVETIEYDPNRSAFIALVVYRDGERRYILAPQGLKVGDRIVCSERAKIKTGNRMQLKNIPTGFPIHDLEIKPGCGAQLVRSAGASAKVTSLDSEMAQVMLPSGSIRFVPKDCYATIGVVSNPDHNNIIIGKAGRKRLMGWRPEVLGKSMNAADHPHGGGKGHSPIGLKQPQTPWGAPALGVKTRRRKKYSNRLIVKRRK